MGTHAVSEISPSFLRTKSGRRIKSGCVCLWVRVAHIVCCKCFACHPRLAVCGDVRYSLSFLIGFIPQRIYIGGYHATSHTRCYLAFTGLALICILLSKVIAANHLFRILTTAALMGIAIFFSPIEATNKPLGKKKRLSYKMVASVLSSIDFLFAIFNVLPDTRSITVYYISKWVLVIFAIIPFFQKQAKIS